MTEHHRIQPRRLRQGDAVGIVAPSGLPAEGWIERGCAAIEARGYRPIVAPHVRSGHPVYTYLAADDRDRAADMNAMFADDDVRAIICACGGYGATRMIDYLDWDVIRANSKLFVGFSDITTLHLALAARAGLVTIHGKMLSSLSTMEEPFKSQFWSVLESDQPYGTLSDGGAPVDTLIPGIAEGETAGGCLCLLSHACGTPWSPDFTDSIVLIEDVGEPIYRVDRFLMQLRQAANLDRAAGFVLGTVSNWEKHEAEPPKNSLLALWRDLLEPLGKPTIMDFPIGHLTQALSVPLGVRARLDATNRTLTLLESATRD